MKIGEKIKGKEYTAVKKNDSIDYSGNFEYEIELEAEDGEKRWFPEWICDGQRESSFPFKLD